MNATLRWQALIDGSTGRLAVRGTMVAAATLDRLSLWQDGAALAQARSPVRAPGWPVLGDAVVHWGPGHWQAGTGYAVSDALLDLCRDGSQVPHCWAWRDDGEQLLVSLSRGHGGPHDADQGPAAAALLVDRQGRPLATLRSDAGAAAAACCLGRRWAVVGSRQASVHAADGRLAQRLGNTAPALRVELCDLERRLLLVQPGRLSLYDTGSGALLGQSDGRWIDAAAAPAGDRLLAVDADGCLALLDTRALDAAPTWLAADDPAQSVAADAAHIVAAFVRPPALRQASWPLS